jgi:hypothetical protein
MGKDSEMNEPVAWLVDNQAYIIKEAAESLSRILESPAIPLYTHPVKEHDIGISHAMGFDDGFKAGMQRAVEMNMVKELTDEEIDECLYSTDWSYDPHSFARAILRKAQEK